MSLDRNITIGMAGPIRLEAYKDLLDKPSIASDAGIEGMGGTVVNIIARNLVKRGYRLTLFSFDPMVKGELILEGKQLRIVMLPYRTRDSRRAFDRFRVERQLLQNAIRRERPDLVHAHWTYEYALGAIASKIPALVTVRDWSPAILRHNRGELKTFLYRLSRHWMNQRTMRSAKWLSANSEPIRQRILEVWKRDVPVLPNPIAPEMILQGEKKWPGPHMIAVSNGFREQKNQKTLFRAFALIRKEFPDVTLAMVGEDFQPGGPAERWAIEQGLSDAVDFVGRVGRDGLVYELDRAALLIHPSPEESFGNVLIEAMARKVAVIGGHNAGAVPWVLGEGRAGLLADIMNESDIAQKTVSLLKDLSRWKELSQSGYDRVLDRFSVDRVLDGTVEQYRLILENTRKVTPG